MRQISRSEGPPPSLWDGLFRRLRDLGGRAENGSLRETLEELIEDAPEDAPGELAPEQRALLLNALSFGQLRVDDVMVPRTDIVAIPAEASLAEVVDAMRQAERARLVVFRETLDDVLGIVHVKDLLQYWGDGVAFKVEDVVRPVLVVPPSMRIIDLLLEMRDKRMHLAVVVDEFGGTDGLVTIEDIVEELVGELQEGAPRQPSTMLVRQADGTLEADARIRLEDLERDLGQRFVSEEEEEEADTLAGLMVGLADRVPQPGDTVRHPSGLVFEVIDGDPRRIRRVRITGEVEPPRSRGEQDPAGTA